MEKIIIWGAAYNGWRLKKDLEKLGDYSVSYFCDNDEKKRGYSLAGVEIISFEDVIQLYEEGYSVNIAISLIESDSVVNQVRSSGLKVRVYAPSYEWKQRLDVPFNNVKSILYEIDINKPRLAYYEYHVSDHCNLKCKGCGHYSNIADPRFGNFEQYVKDIYRLKELYWGVKRIRLMGGDPLLNKNLPEFCIVTRKVFPDANIRVVTNGLLIPSIKKEVLRIMAENFIAFDITQYPPTSEIKEKIELKCIENDVRYVFSTVIEKFFHYNFHESDEELNHDKCISKGCHFLENGKISVCGLPILYKKYENRICKNMRVSEEDIIDIYDKELDGFVLNDFLSRPISLCKYCDYKKMEWFNWQGNYTDLI